MSYQASIPDYVIYSFRTLLSPVESKVNQSSGSALMAQEKVTHI
jgi:hypothetical protein